jgi:hypothetical protein
MKTLFDNQTKFVFDERIQLTTINEFGIHWHDLLAGEVKPPSQGARFDLLFEGSLTGPDLAGHIKGVDYLEVRADGRFMLNIFATVITDDNEAIALHEDGIAIPAEDNNANLQLNLTFTTNSEKYRWLNQIQVWGIGQVDLITGKISVRAYTGDFIGLNETA